jgi:23S rRNA (cytosine1962-C5)-methyltransferase
MLEEMVDEGRTFDIVILDPPSFAQNQESVHRALGSYERLAKLGMALTANGGTLVQASCSSRIDLDQLIDVADAAARASGVYLDEIRRTEHPVDHPIGFEFGAYLKALYFTISHI